MPSGIEQRVSALLQTATLAAMAPAFGRPGPDLKYSGRRRLTVEGPTPWLVSFMGFTGPELRGCLSLAASRDTAVAMSQMETESDHPPSRAELSDWMCELCNRMVGSVQARLIPVGVMIQLAIPTCVQGSTLEVLSRDAELEWHAHRTPEGRVYVRATADVSPNFSFQESSADESPIEEGGALIF